MLEFFKNFFTKEEHFKEYITPVVIALIVTLFASLVIWGIIYIDVI